MEKIDISQVEMNPFTSIGLDDFLLSAGDESGWNTMTAGWGGLGYMWGKPCCFVFVRESRYTLSFMDKFDSFSVSFFPPEKKSILSLNIKTYHKTILNLSIYLKLIILPFSYVMKLKKSMTLYL